MLSVYWLTLALSISLMKFLQENFFKTILLQFAILLKFSSPPCEQILLGSMIRFQKIKIRTYHLCSDESGVGRTVWLTPPNFTLEMMAAVIACVQTAPASAHKNTIREYPGGIPKFTPNVDQPQTKQERNETTHCASLVCLCILCLQQC